MLQVQVTEKVDGISIELVYQDGSLIEFVTRGDGLVGDDIFPHAKYISNIPQTIPEKGLVVIRGEIVMPLDNFEKIWKPQGVKNPRNLVSGLCKGRSSPADLSTMSLVAYEYHGPRRNKDILSEQDSIGLLQHYKFFTPNIECYCDTSESIIELFEDFDSQDPDNLRDTIPYQTDGIVLKVNKFSEQELFEPLGNRPGWCVAVKPTSKSCITKVIGLTWDNRHSAEGQFCPVAEVEPAELDGTTLRHINLYNLDALVRWVEKGFGIGAEVKVIRTGDILPMLKEVITPAPVSN